MKKLFLLLCVWVSSLGCFADEVKIDGINYWIYTNNTAEVDESNCRGDIVIPESITYNGHEYRVVWIGNDAFEDCTGLTSIVIPNSVTSIGTDAFSGCTGLTSVTIGNSVKTIGDQAFEECTSLASISIPNSVTSIGYEAFSDCTGLTSVTLPESLTSIGHYAFDGCTGLTAVHISDLATWCEISLLFDHNPLYYAHHLYLNGEELKGDLVIPDGLTSIGNSTFCGCSGLTSVTIPNSVTSIGQAAFSGCI